MQTETPTMQQEAARGLESLMEDFDELDAEAEEADDDDLVRDSAWEMPLCVEALTTVRVTLGTGGPARGVDFTVETNRWGGHDYVSATFWHQDWFQPKAHVQIDDNFGSRLFDLWGISEFQAV